MSYPYRLSIIKSKGGYVDWFQNSFEALLNEFPHISVDDRLYEQYYDVMLTRELIGFKSEADAMMFILKWN